MQCKEFPENSRTVCVIERAVIEHDPRPITGNFGRGRRGTLQLTLGVVVSELLDARQKGERLALGDSVRLSLAGDDIVHLSRSAGVIKLDAEREGSVEVVWGRALVAVRPRYSSGTIALTHTGQLPYRYSVPPSVKLPQVGDGVFLRDAFGTVFYCLGGCWYRCGHDRDEFGGVGGRLSTAATIFIGCDLEKEAPDAYALYLVHLDKRLEQGDVR